MLIEILKLLIGEVPVEGILRQIEEIAVLIDRQEDAERRGIVDRAADRDGVVIRRGELLAQIERIAHINAVFEQIPLGDQRRVRDLWDILRPRLDAVDRDVFFLVVLQGRDAVFLRAGDIGLRLLGEDILVFRELGVDDRVVEMAQQGREHAAEHEQHARKEDAEGENGIGREILQQNARAEAVEKRPMPQLQDGLLFLRAQLAAQKLQRRELQRPPEDERRDDGNDDKRDDRRERERLPVPDGFVGRERIAVVIHAGGDLLHPRIAHDVAEHGGGEGAEQRQREIMAQELEARIAARAERADGAGLALDGAARRDGEDEGQNDHDDINERLEHGIVAAHVVAGEDDRLIAVLREEVRELGGAVDRAHETGRRRARLGFGEIVVPAPGVAALQSRVAEGVKGLVRHDGDGELVGVEHHVVVALKERAVIRKSGDAGDGVIRAVDAKRVAHGNFIILGIKPVEDDLPRRLGESARHDVEPVHLRARAVKAHGVRRLCLAVNIIQRRDGDALVLLELRDLLRGERSLDGEVAVLDAVCFKALVIGALHAAVGDEIARGKADEHEQEEKERGVFAPVLAQGAKQAASERISHGDHQASATACTRMSCCASSRIAPSRRRMTRSAMGESAALCVTMSTVQP